MPELARGLLIIAELLPLMVGRDDGRELVIALGQRPGLVSVRVHGGVREGTLQLSVLAGHVAEPIEHDQDLLSLQNGPSARRADSPCKTARPRVARALTSNGSSARRADSPCKRP